MQTKLTLRMRSALIERAKAQAHEEGKSVSQMVADYFVQLDQPVPEQPLPPVVASLIGALKVPSAGAGAAPMDESDYRDYLAAKHQ